jgi:hypothetical protein
LASGIDISRSSVPLVRFAQHRDRGDQEHHDQRKETDQRRADALERVRLVVEDVLEEGEQGGCDEEDHRERARIAAQLAEHARGGGERSGDGHAASASATKASSSSSV